jgi:hypothetical protein
VFDLVKVAPSTNTHFATKVHDRDDAVIIATASSSTPGPSVIRLWLWKPDASNGREWLNQRWAFVTGLEWLLKLLIMIAAVAYVINMFKGQVGTFHGVDMADITGKKGSLKGHGYKDMMAYIHREMAVEFDAIMAWD